MEDSIVKNFVHLRAQSSYSLLESAIKIPALIGTAKKNAMKAVCLTDNSNLFGSLEFAIEAIKNKIHPIHGLIIELEYLQDEYSPEFAQILLLAKDEIGYKNLLHLSSIPYLNNPRKFKPHISFDDLESYSAGIICLSGYKDGPIGRELLKNNHTFAKELAEKFQRIFQDRFYFEIFRHGDSQEKQIERVYLDIAKKLDLPLVATNKVLFENIEMHDAHDVLLCIAAGVTKGHPSRPRVSNQCYFKAAKEMAALFSDIPSAIENAGYIAERCSIYAREHDPMLPNFSDDGSSENDILKSESHKGLELRLKHKFEIENITSKVHQDEIAKQYFDRLDYELSVVLKMNFAGYFLIVSDFIKWSKQNGIYVGPGRGSGAGSIIAWSLLITDLDPIRFGLLFERFLNPERISMPDFDIDFCQERREEVINYVRSKYGNDRVAQIITFGKLQAKAVMKDVSRVLGLRYEIADYLTELVPFNAVNPVTLDQAVIEVSELRQAHKGDGLYNYQEDNELIQQVIETSLVLEGLHRHCSVHAAGIVISGTKLLDVVPLYKDASGDMSIIQYSMKYAELAGLVKFDFLGLQTLTVISKTIELLEKSGTYIDLSKISFTDIHTYEMLSTGAGVGVFQFESVGMKDTLRKLKPDCIEDLMALGALYRPGPMDNIPTYIACKHKRQLPDYLHPKLEPILRETYGVIVYQEQVLEIAKVLAGYSLGAADLLRRAMGKKIKAEMDAQEKLFREGAEQNGISASDAKDIFASVAKFAGYGFNRAHAASYAVISYYTAYLKANYPVEFFVACLNLDISDQDQINVFKEEARALNIEISPPDINHSSGLFSIKYDKEKQSIIYALGAIKSVTVNLGNEIAQNREKAGSFKSVSDFIRRISGKLLTKRSLEALIKAGALDSVHHNRKQLLLSVPTLLSYGTKYTQDKTLNQISLFKTEESCDNLLVNINEDFDHHEKSLNEFEVLGLFSKHHPLTHYTKDFATNKITPINQIQNQSDGSGQILIAGFISKKDARMSARGRFITLSLSDSTGSTDITIFSENVLKEYSHLLAPKSLVIVRCDIFKDGGTIKLTASQFYDCFEFLSNNYSKMKYSIGDLAMLEKISNIVKSFETSDGKDINIELHINVDDYIAIITLSTKNNIAAELKSALSNLNIEEICT